jgi:DNA-binding response OmpR family regulator
MSNDARILVVEDQPTIRMCLVQILDKAGYQVLTAGNGLEALDIIEEQPVDLILADIMMPEMDGYALYRRVAEDPKWVSTPFIFLTARMLDQDIRYGKELGVDDYLVKPVAADDLLASVRGRLRRAERIAHAAQVPAPRRAVETDVLELGRLRIEPDQYRVWLNDEPLKLSNTEFTLLAYMTQRANKVVPMQEIVRATHNLETNYAEASSLLRPMIRSIRRKLGYPAGNTGCIESVRGVGYRFVPTRDA